MMMDEEFEVSGERGFLPRHNPLGALPAEYSMLETLMKDLPAILKIKDEISIRTEAMPSYIDSVKSVSDSRLALALFRDYCFWASAFCLEPCHWHRLALNPSEAGETLVNEYGKARDSLPEKIAAPLRHLAGLFGTSPWLEYAHAYALANYRLINPDLPWDERFRLDNLDLIRRFEGSVDEAGFILVHVSMASQTPRLVAGIRKCNRGEYRAGLQQVYDAMEAIHERMEAMWDASRPPAYHSFRTFIMGIKDQPMFPPAGLHYEPDPPETRHIHRCYV